MTLALFGPSGGGSLGSLLFLAGLGTLFHHFGRCPNHNDFLLQLISQSAPKFVFVTLAPFGPRSGSQRLGVYSVDRTLLLSGLASIAF